jgi:hypothetical protein
VALYYDFVKLKWQKQDGTFCEFCNVRAVLLASKKGALSHAPFTPSIATNPMVLIDFV